MLAGAQTGDAGRVQAADGSTLKLDIQDTSSGHGSTCHSRRPVADFKGRELKLRFGLVRNWNVGRHRASQCSDLKAADGYTETDSN
jgi:hypothetical protein